MRVGFMIGSLAALAAAQAAAQTSVGVMASVRIEQPAAIIASQDLVFAMIAPALVPAPAVRTPTSASAAARSPASMIQMASSPIVPGAARASFMVSGDGGQSISVVVPENVALVRDGGVETATLTTDASIGDGPQFLAGNFDSGGTLSFDVGGQVTLASNAAASGTYNGVLAVVAQYN